MLYDDDGVSFDYEKGAFSWSELTAKFENGAWKPELKIGNTAAFNYSQNITWIFMGQ